MSDTATAIRFDRDMATLANVILERQDIRGTDYIDQVRTAIPGLTARDLVDLCEHLELCPAHLVADEICADDQEACSGVDMWDELDCWDGPTCRPAEAFRIHLTAEYGNRPTV